MIDKKRLETAPVQHIRDLMESVSDGKITIGHEDPLELFSQRTFEVSCGVTDREKLFSATEAERVEQAKIKLSNMNLIIDDDTISLTVSQIEERLENYDNIGMIVIDYFQLLLPDQRTIDREQECDEIARKLKEISRRVGIPIIFTSHLPRSVEYRKDKRPLLIDLKGAGVPEQYVDTICLIYREGYYDIDSENDAADIIVAKNQYGSCDVLSFEWQGKFMKYIEKTR